MAITATISVAPTSGVVTESDVTAIVTVSNSGSSPVTITQVTPLVYQTSSAVSTYNSVASVGPVNTGPNTNLTVGASGSLVVTFPFTVHSPSTGYLSNGTGTISVGAVIYTSDGSVTSPTATTLTVNYAVSYTAAQS